MYGKVMKVSEYELKFGQREQFVDVFGCFKYLKNGNSYVIYSNVNEIGHGKVRYGLFHKDKSKGKIVSLEPKVGDSEIVKEFIWKLVNSQELNYYEIIPIDDIDKIEIISNDTLNLKIDVLEKLKDITIPKKEFINQVEVKKNTHPVLKFILCLLILVVGIASFLFSYNIGEYLGYGEQITCVKKYSYDELEADIENTVTVYYNRDGKMARLVDNKAYIFNTYEEYYKFKEQGEYFKYQPANLGDDSNTSGISFDDENNIFRTIVNIKNDSEYYIGDVKIEENIDKDYNNLTNDGFICVREDRDE